MSLRDSLFSLLVLGFLMIGTEARSNHHHSEVHKLMTKRDLGLIFGVDLHDLVPDYDIVHPTEVKSFRSRRSDDEQLEYKLKAFNKDLHLNLRKNNEFLGPNFHVELVGHEGKVLERRSVKDCYYHGNVHGHVNSQVAVSNCEGLRGMIKSQDDSYLIEPLPVHLHIESVIRGSTTPHILYRRSTSASGGHTATHSHVNFCGVKDDDPSMVYRRDKTQQPQLSDSSARTTGSEKWIEALVVVDPKMVETRGSDAVQNYALAVSHVANKIIKDGTIGSPRPIYTVMKLMILTVNQPGLVINSHASNSKLSFGNWVRKTTKFDDDSSPDHYDHATLITGFNICSDSYQPCDTLGLATVSGMCDFPSSVTINQDSGLLTGHTIAHETGHTLSMNHDGKGNRCPNGPHVMSTRNFGEDTQFEWSSCSKSYYINFLSSEQASCLDDRPTGQYEDLTSKNNPGLEFDADAQCAMREGDGSKFCEWKKEGMCKNMWCTNPKKEGSCSSAYSGAIDGTVCGDKKWCQNAKCVAWGSSGPAAQNGQWSAWGAWEQCTRTCGGGVTIRRRECSNPPPKYGGMECTGIDKLTKICNERACSRGAKDFRNVQCERWNNKPQNGRYYRWEYKQSTNPNQCLRTCFMVGTRSGRVFGDFDDGTNCENDMKKCVGGQCMGVDCDGNISPTSTPCPSSSRARDMVGSAKKTIEETGNEWVLVKSACSVACGGGTLSLIPECHDVNGNITNENICKADNKPLPATEACNEQPCGYSWKASDWGDCSVTCNGGTRTRELQCTQMKGEAIELVVEDERCLEEKPSAVEPCNDIECTPEWVAMPFGPCSTSCGHGEQSREVVCQQADKQGVMQNVDLKQCENITMKPVAHQNCNIFNPCPGDGNCGGNYTGLKGSFTSPGWPKPYPRNIICVYNIRVPDGMRIRLRINPIQFGHVRIIEGLMHDECMLDEDFVEIVDENGEVIRICNEPSIPYLSAGSHLTVFFESKPEAAEAVVKRNKKMKGFVAHFKATKAKAVKDIEHAVIQGGIPLNKPVEPGTGKEREVIVTAEPDIKNLKKKTPRKSRSKLYSFSKKQFDCSRSRKQALSIFDENTDYC